MQQQHGAKQTKNYKQADNCDELLLEAADSDQSFCALITKL